MHPRRLPILFSLLLAFFAVAASDEIDGCGGFVEVGMELVSGEVWHVFSSVLNPKMEVDLHVVSE